MLLLSPGRLWFGLYSLRTVALETKRAELQESKLGAEFKKKSRGKIVCNIMVKTGFKFRCDFTWTRGRVPYQPNLVRTQRCFPL